MLLDLQDSGVQQDELDLFSEPNPAAAQPSPAAGTGREKLMARWTS